jgi:GNAT superfamily N-acetyltransferase
MTNDEIQLLEARPDDAAVREAVLAITRAAFLVNPETGQRIEGDTPSEMPMVEALLERGAVDHLHTALLGDRVVGYILYTRGTLSGNPGLHVQGLTIMGVAPQLQRRGIGTRLLVWSVDQMKGACDVPAHTLGLSFSFPAPEDACMVAPVGGRPLPPGVLSYHPIVHEFF